MRQRKKLFVLAMTGLLLVTATPMKATALQPTLHFYSTVNGQAIAMPDTQVVTLDSHLKLYFHAKNHMTIEYKGYIFDQGTGQYDDLKIGGAFTGGVEESFVGMDLSDTNVTIQGNTRKFQKGDVIVFKFRAVSNDGYEETREMKALIGDATTDLSVLDSIQIP